MAKETGILFRGDMVRALDAGRKHMTRRPVNIERLRVTLPATVTSDEPAVLGTTAHIVARPGVYPARLNAGGAVTIITKQGELGVKPGEFHFRCPYADGSTVLTNRGNGRTNWSIEVRDSILWVRESFWIEHDSDNFEMQDAFDCGIDLTSGDWARVQYVASHENPAEPDVPGEWFGPDEYFPERTWVQWGIGGCLTPRFFSKRPGIHMPRWASRFTFRVASVRIERLQDITEEDAIAEGAFFTDYGLDEYKQPRPGWSMAPTTSHEQCSSSARGAFAYYYNRIHGGDDWNLKPNAPWDANDWTWCISFERVAQEKAA